MNEQTPIDALNFEEALTQLETIVRDLETGKSPLEESINAYERGIALKKHCQAKLNDAQAKIEKITIAKDGDLSTQPLDGEQ